MEDVSLDLAIPSAQLVGGQLPESQLPTSVLSSSSNIVYADTFYNLNIYASKSAALQAGLDQAQGSGPATFALTPGRSYALDTAPLKLNRSLAGLVVNLNGGTLKLSAEAPRAFDFNKVADYDTFQNIEIGNGFVDRNNIGGSNHTVLGIWRAGSWQTRLNLANIKVHDVTILNAPQGEVGAVIYGVNLDACNAPGDTLCTVTNCSAKNIYSTGCDQLVTAHGAPSGANTTANTYHDEIVIEDIHHPLPTTPTSFFAQAHVMAGTKGKGGSIRINRIFGQNSRDVGIECDGYQDAEILGIHIVDSYDYPVYHLNYATPVDVELQQMVITGTIEFVNITHGQGIKIGDSGNEKAVGRPSSVHLDMTYKRRSEGKAATIANGVGEALDAYGPRRLTGTIRTIIEIGTYTSTETYSPSALLIHAPDTTTRTSIDLKAKARVTGTVGSTGLIAWRTLLLRDGRFTDFDIDVESDLSLTSGGNAGVTHADIGSVEGSAEASVLSGRLAVKVPTTGGGGNTPVGIRFESGAFNAIVSTSDISVHDSDMTGLASTSSNVTFAGTSLAAGVRFESNKWKQSHQKRRIISATGSTNLDTLYDSIGVTATGAEKTLPLPTVAPAGKEIVVVDEGGDAATFNVVVTIASAGTFIDGTSSKKITTNYGVARFRYTGAKWQQV